jgi:APA family basic amino acid/polyamine antiporter
MTELRRVLTLYGLTMVAVGSCIGSGIFLTPSQVASHVMDPTLVLMAWTLGGVIALTGALSFAELGAMFPNAGGVYVYLREAYGSFAGFLYGWAYFTVINGGSIAALTIAFAYYVSFLVPLSASGQIILAICAVVTITLVNVFRVQVAEYFTNALTGLKLAGIGVVVLIGLFLGTSGMDLNFAVTGSLLTNDGLGAFGLAMVGVLFSYGGWQHASYLSGEAVDPQRTVPRAMIIGALIVTAAYLLINVAYMLLLPVSEMAASTRVAADAVNTVFPWGGKLVAVLIAISTFGTALIYTLSAPRIYFAMAADRVFFAKLAEVHPKFRTPVYSVVAQSVWAIALILFWGTFEKVITYVTFTDWIFFTATACIVILFRLKRPSVERPYRTFGYPVTPLIFIIISAWFVVNTLIRQPVQAGAGLAFLALGYPIFWVFRRRLRRQERQ